MINKMWNVMNSAFILAVISFLFNLISRKKDSIKRYLITYEIKNDMEVFFLVQTELISLIFSMIISGVLIDTLQIKYNFNILCCYIFIFVISTVLNILIVCCIMSFIKQMRKLSKINLIAVVLLNIIFTLCLICYSEERFIVYTKYVKYIITSTCIVLLIIQSILNCKNVKTKKIEYKIDTLDFEHYVTYDNPIYKSQFIIIKQEKGHYIEIPVTRIKKITYIICSNEIDNK